MKFRDIDVTFDFRKDNRGKDPDVSSPTLRAYQQLLWSKPLPNGQMLCLTTDGSSYLRWGDMYFGSDSITASFRYVRNEDFLKRVAQTMTSFDDYIEDFLRRAYTIGGEILFPQHVYSMNQARGMSRRICDRWDLTLECIRLFYTGETSPLEKALDRSKPFFELFVDFKGYVDFFLLQDCVDENYNVRFWMDTPLFVTDPMPKTPDSYKDWISKQLDFLEKRNMRIKRYCEE